MLGALISFFRFAVDQDAGDTSPKAISARDQIAANSGAPSASSMRFGKGPRSEGVLDGELNRACREHCVNEVFSCQDVRR